MRTGRHKTKLAKLLGKNISVSRGVLITFIGLVAVFGLMSLISYLVPSSRVMLAPLTILLSFLPTIFLFFVGVNLSVPPQQFIDIFFFFVALPYWFALSMGSSILYNQIKKSGRNFWTGVPFALLIFLVLNTVGAYYFTEYNLGKSLTSIQMSGLAIMILGNFITGYVIGSLHEEKRSSSPHRKVHDKNIDKNS